MEHLFPIILFLVGLVAGATTCWLVMNTKIEHAIDRTQGEERAQMSVLRTDLRHRREMIEELKVQQQEGRTLLQKIQGDVLVLKAREAQLETTIQQERRQAAEKMDVLNKAQQQLSDAFKVLSSDALKSNNESFLQLAKTTLERFQESARGDLDKRQQAIDALVVPVEKSLKQVDTKLQDIEKNRLEAYTGLKEQVKMLTETHQQLRTETSNLAKALRRPNVRGRWGEIQLKRVVEMAGMLNHCDFFEQRSVVTADGQLRPDLVVKLPGNKNIVIDAKVPLEAFLDALETTDEQIRLAKQREHARQVKTHLKSLSKKSYFSQFDHTPEFVVLFLPGEVFFSVALEHDPSLIEMGIEQNVIIATPTTLIALLKAVAYGWTQERLAENAQEISELGKELYKRLSQMGDHLSKVGKALEGATKAYNAAIGSLESRVFVTARRFDQLHVAAAGNELRPPPAVKQTTRLLQTPETFGSTDSADPRSE